MTSNVLRWKSASGASVLRTMTSTYGNVKGIAVRVEAICEPASIERAAATDDFKENRQIEAAPVKFTRFHLTGQRK